MGYKATVFFVLLGFFVVVLGLYGYIANIVSLVTHNEAMGLSIARAVGIFVAPLGAVLGFI